jgi:DNA-binding NarL/FixJ family response regulator
MNVRILLVDSHNIVRQAIGALIRERPDMQVVGETDTATGAIRAPLETRPDVVVTEATMPDMDAAEAARRILEAAPGVRILVLSAHHDERWVGGMLNAGASGYVPKTCTAEELIAAIDAVVANRKYLSPEVEAVLAGTHRRSGKPRRGTHTANGLTPRQRSVLTLMADGLSTADIARKLGLSMATVGMHRRLTMAALGLHSPADLIRYAVRTGIVSLEQRE